MMKLKHLKSLYKNQAIYRIFINLCILTLFFSSLCYTDLYFWIDEGGIKHYSNTQPADNAKIAEFPETPSNEIIIDDTHKHKSTQISKVQHERKVPTPTVSIEYKYYEVKGVNINDLNSETVKYSPIKQNGTTYIGNAMWHIKPYYKAKQNDGS